MATTPSAPMILVTTHASSDIIAYDPSNGQALPGCAIDTSSVTLLEPRGIYRDAWGNILLIEGDKSDSRVYQFLRPTQPGGQYGPGYALITHDTGDSIDHPFALAFAGLIVSPQATVWVSNQDSNVVAGFSLFLQDGRFAASPLDVAKYLGQFGTPDRFLQGTTVASAVGNLPGVGRNPPIVKTGQGGLDATFGKGADSGKIKHSVRDVALLGGFLLVVDEPSGVVRLYDAVSGDYLGSSTVDNATSKTLTLPTHLLVDGDTIYVSTSNRIYSGPLMGGEGSASLDLTHVFTSPGGDISGMAMDEGGNFYFADRDDSYLYSYTAGFATQRWKSGKVGASPEFLLYLGS